jgi:DNA invertase Pin-like site-specific DNA recombinase
MLIGYARTSTIDQAAGLEAQERDLKAAGVEKLFTEQVSSVADREQLEAALDYVRDGDVLVVTKLDRLARSIRDLCSIVDRLTAKGVSLRILGMGLDTATANGRLMLNVLGSVAQFEREVMLERQREGIAKAKGEGKFKGRAPLFLNVGLLSAFVELNGPQRWWTTYPAGDGIVIWAGRVKATVSLGRPLARQPNRKDVLPKSCSRPSAKPATHRYRSHPSL